MYFLPTCQQPVRPCQEGLQWDGCLHWHMWHSNTVCQSDYRNAVKNSTSIDWCCSTCDLVDPILLLKALQLTLATLTPLSMIHLLLSLLTSHLTSLLILSKILLLVSHPLLNRLPERMTCPAQHLKSPFKSSVTPLQRESKADQISRGYYKTETFA